MVNFSIENYSAITYDNNPIHKWEGKDTKPIVPGMLLGSMFSAMIGSRV